jgi:undecaprenyl phosphate-alpha-L-ara4N flippase subunit ArnE
MTPEYLWLAAAISLGVVGQLVLKCGASASASTLSQLLSPWTIGGFAIYFMSAVSYVIAIKRIPVSLAYPSVSISYGLIVVLAHLIWNEPLTWQHVAGILLISTGIFVLFRA